MDLATQIEALGPGEQLKLPIPATRGVPSAATMAFPLYKERVTYYP